MQNEGRALHLGRRVLGDEEVLAEARQAADAVADELLDGEEWRNQDETSAVHQRDGLGSPTCQVGPRGYRHGWPRADGAAK